MPPEPLPPWDHRFKDKRHDRPPPPDPALAPPRARWRDTPAAALPARDFDPRRTLGPGRQKSYHIFPKEADGGGYAFARSGSRGIPPEEENYRSMSRYDRSGGGPVAPGRDFEPRRPLGPRRQKSYHIFPKEPVGGEGYAWARSGSRGMHPEEESYRSMTRYSRSGGSGGGFGPESRGPFTGGASKDWRNNIHHQHGAHQYQRHYHTPPPWEFGPPPPPQQVDGQVQRTPVDEDRHVPSRPSPHRPPPVKTAPAVEEATAKDPPEKVPTGKELVGEKESSLGPVAWKRWSRATSLVSRGSESLNVSEEPKVESPAPKQTTPLLPTVAVDAATSNGVLQDEEATHRKKQRLGWGEGLAKYEKKKVEGPEDSAGGKEGEDSKTVQNTPCVSDCSPKVAALPECTSSPATPSSVGCSSSSGFDDTSFNKLSNNDIDACHYSPGHACINSPEDDLIPEHFELESTLPNIGNVIFDLVQADDGNCVDSNFLKSRTLSKLMLVKSNILKDLDKTDGEIESSENELRDLEPKKDTPVNSSIRADQIQVFKPCNQQLLMETAVSTSDLCQDEQQSAEIVPAKMEGSSLPIWDRNDAANEKSSLDDCIGSGLSTGVSENVLCSNDDAEKSLEVCTEVASDVIPKFDIWEAHKHRSYDGNRDLVKSALSSLKSKQKSKEKILCLKFKLFQNLWKEELRVLALKKSRPKLQKRCEPSYRPLHSATQRQKSVVRSRVTPPVVSSALVPTAEIKELTEKLLSKSQIKAYRENLKMPTMILDERERISSRFISTNGLVEDPVSLEQEKAHHNPWTSEEKEIFMEMLATYGKDFAKIASSLCYKTTADCVEFYYKNHKSDSFEKIKKQMGLRKQEQCLTNVYLVASKKKRIQDESAALLDDSGTSMHSNRLNSNRSDLGKNTATMNIDVHGTDRETVAADVLAGIRGGLSSEAISSCITSTIERREILHTTKMLRSKAGRYFTNEISSNVDEESIPSDDSSEEPDSVFWTDEEKSAFIMALRTYGKDFVHISRCVGSRSRDQCKIFFSKTRKCLGLDTVHTGLEGMPATDANGRGCDSDDDACALEVESAICSTHSCSKVEVELPNTSREVGHDGIDDRLFGNEQKVAVFDDISIGEAKLTEFEVNYSILSPDGEANGTVTEELVDDRLGQDQEVIPVKKESNSFVFHVTNCGKKDHADDDKCGLDSCYKDSTMQVAPHSPNVKGSARTIASMSDSACLHEEPLELASSQNPPDSTWQLIEKCSQKSDTQMPMPSSNPFEQHHKDWGRMSSLALEEGLNESQGRYDLDFSQNHLLENQSLSSAERQTYSPHVLSMKDANGSIIGESRFVLHNFPNADLNVFPGEVLVSPDSCNGLKHALPSMPSSDPPGPKVEGFGDPHRISPSVTEKYDEQTCKTGDVRLFGQIITQKKSVQTMSGKSSIADLDSSASVRLSSEQKEGTSGMPKKTEIVTSDDKEKIIMTSYSHWNGTGHSPLPDSTVLAPTKYPVSLTDCHPTRVYPVTREIMPDGNGAVLDAYNHLYRSNFDRSNVKSYTVMDTKLQERILPDLQNHRGGFESTAGYQQGLVGMNVVSGSMLVGRGCTGVSDPVAAIKMHYATATSEKLFGAVSNGVVRDEDSWSGNVGR